MTKVCNSCGRTIPLSAERCPRCGAAQPAIYNPEQTVTPDSHGESSQPLSDIENINAASAAKNSKKKSRNPVKYIFPVALVLIALSLIPFFNVGFTSADEDDSQNDGDGISAVSDDDYAYNSLIQNESTEPFQPEPSESINDADYSDNIGESGAEESSESVSEDSDYESFVSQENEQSADVSDGNQEWPDEEYEDEDSGDVEFVREDTEPAYDPEDLEYQEPDIIQWNRGQWDWETDSETLSLFQSAFYDYMDSNAISRSFMDETFARIFFDIFNQKSASDRPIERTITGVAYGGIAWLGGPIFVYREDENYGNGYSVTVGWEFTMEQDSEGNYIISTMEVLARDRVSIEYDDPDKEYRQFYEYSLGTIIYDSESSSLGFKASGNPLLPNDRDWNTYTQERLEEEYGPNYELILKAPAEEFLYDSNNVRITVQELNQYSQDTLLLMLHEIYARRGCTFANETTQNYFLEKSWYSPIDGLTLSNFDTSTFNSVEAANVRTIIDYAREQGWVTS